MKKRSGPGPFLSSATDKQHEGELSQPWVPSTIDEPPTDSVFAIYKFWWIQNVTVVIQSKQLRKLIQQTFQQFATLKEDDCMVKFFDTLKEFVSYDEEVFPCELVVSRNYYAQPDGDTLLP